MPWQGVENVVVHGHNFVKRKQDNLYLSDNFEPVSAELCRTGVELPTIGCIPSELEGARKCEDFISCCS